MGVVGFSALVGKVSANIRDRGVGGADLVSLGRRSHTPRPDPEVLEWSRWGVEGRTN